MTGAPRTRVVVGADLWARSILSAAVDGGALEPAPRTLHVRASHTFLPERELARDDLPDGADVVDLDAVLAPLPAKGFAPRRSELRAWESLLRAAWGVEGPVEVVVTDLGGSGLALARVFATAPLVVVAADTQVHGPPTRVLSPDVLGRVRVIVRAGLVEALLPSQAPPPLLMLHGSAAEVHVVPVAAVLDALDALATAESRAERLPTVPRSRPGADALIVLDAAHAHMEVADAVKVAQACVRVAHDELAQPPTMNVHLVVDPGCVSAHGGEVLRALRAERGAPWRITPTLAAARSEQVLLALLARPSVVVASDPVILAVARTLEVGLATPAVDEMLDLLAPYEHPARTALVVADLASRGDTSETPPASLTLQAVAYCMRPDVLEHVRASAEVLIAAFPAVGPQERPGWRRYVKKRRAEKLGLLSPPPPRALPPTLTARTRRRLAALLPAAAARRATA